MCSIGVSGTLNRATLGSSVHSTPSRANVVRWPTAAMAVSLLGVGQSSPVVVHESGVA